MPRSKSRSAEHRRRLNAEYKRVKRAAETLEDTETRRAYVRAGMKRRRAEESPETTETRRASARAWMKRQRAEATPEAAVKRRASVKAEMKELPTQSGTEEPGDINGSSLSSFPRSNISTSSAASKKMGLKLASFASLRQNGIADTTPVRGHGNISGCKQCRKEIDRTVDQLLMWQTMQFCCKTCLKNYQTDFKQCSSCSKTVSKTSVGRYCVRFGSDIKQFCSNVCLETSKEGLEVCCYCQKDISGGEGFLAQIGDKEQLNDFCLPSCLKRYEALHLGKPLEKEVLPCAVCSDLKPVEVQLLLKGSSIVKFCGNPCFSAFKFVNSLGTSYCDLCANPYDIHASDHVIYYENHVKRFCSMSCQNVYIMKFRKIVPCQWCKVKKFNFDMVEKPSPKGVVFNTVYCSVNCLNLHGFKRKGDVTHVSSPPRNPPSWNPPKPTAASSSSTVPVIQSSLAPENPPPSLPFTAAPEQPPSPILDPATPEFKTGIIRENIVKCPNEVRNKVTLKKLNMSTKGVSCKPLSTSKSTQTDAPPPSCLLPLPVPFYLPVPLRMYASPYPVPVPIPLPIPVPVFMPIKRSSLEGVKKSLQKIHDKLPSDPFEAELLVMDEAIADKASSLLKDSDTEEEEDEDTDNLAAASLENNGDNNKDEMLLTKNNEQYGADLDGHL